MVKVIKHPIFIATQILSLNNSVIDTANVDQLASLLKTIDLPSIPKYTFPPKLKRLVDLLSISKSKLFGYKNLNNKDYNTYGYRESEVYGQNLGDALTITSKVVPGDIVVGFEKYSGTYVALNTNVPLSASQAPPLFSDPGIFYSSSTGSMLPSSGTANKYYILSAFDSSWGWPILSGGGRSIFDIYKSSNDCTKLTPFVIYNNKYQAVLFVNSDTLFWSTN